MTVRYDLDRMRREILEDEEIRNRRNRPVTQEEIRRLVEQRRARKKANRGERS